MVMNGPKKHHQIGTPLEIGHVRKKRDNFKRKDRLPVPSFLRGKLAVRFQKE